MNHDLHILKIGAAALACLFALAGVLTFAARGTNWGRSMGAATVSWAVICAVFLVVPFFGVIPFAVVMVAIAVLALREFYQITRICHSLRLLTSAFFVVAMAAALVLDHETVFHRLPLVALITMLVIHAWRFSYNDIARTVAIQALGLTYWGWLLLHWLLLRQMADGYGLILSLCAMIVVNDNGAFFFGKLFGKNSPKLAPMISPNKTWVGFAGGALCSILVAWGFGFALTQLSLPQRLVLGLVVGVAVPGGGLIESAMKRDAGVKDSGTLIPGHGGFMDRFDSWAFSAPIVYLLLKLYAVYPF
jgi:phosphatidate cytidylyltransferase